MTYKTFSKPFETAKDARDFSSMISQLVGYQWISTVPIGATPHYRVQYIQYDHLKFDYAIELCHHDEATDVCKSMRDCGYNIIRRVRDSVDISMIEITYLSPKLG